MTMGIMNHDDAATGKWFRYNGEECAACYLGHSHSYDDHCLAIAKHRAGALAQAQEPDYLKRLHLTPQIARKLLPEVKAATPLLNGAWE